MKKLNDGQVSSAAESDEGVYKALKGLCDIGLELGNEYWNWPLVGYLTFPSLQRILNLAWIYEMQKKSSGSILEFGVHYGSSFVQLINLRSIHEPYNYARHIYGFDTFDGFKDVTNQDGAASQGDFKVSNDYEIHLENLCSLHEKLAPKSHLKKFSLLKGNASEKLQELISKRPDMVVSLVIFDMDIYKPTKEVLQMLKPHLHKGSILVFDEFNCPHFPGETVAAMEELDFGNVEFIQSPYLPFNSVCKFES
ncbi:class I SAM-dependent methyltransferase [Litorivicinus sp.]|jgi:hypothetical protein|nr:class I SAM-dependent methyltransferase [Litorivicinus sp.]